MMKDIFTSIPIIVGLSKADSILLIEKAIFGLVSVRYCKAPITLGYNMGLQKRALSDKASLFSRVSWE